ncbi:MAG TPA: X2-like carbohydrate binding domain-containing protein, partial [Clostridia bacterium]
MRKIISIYAVMLFVLLLIPHASFASSGTADISPSEVKTDFVSMKDIEVTTSVTDSVYLNSITNGTYALIPGTDYMASGSIVNIKKSYVQYYLNKFSNQNLYLSFNFSDGNSEILTIYRGSSPHPELITTSVNYYAGSSYDVKIQLILNGNFITSVQAGSYKFVQ